jgi:nucleoside-diphosphate-sugar epimerase
MRVFLTGATGYVGSVVAERLLQNGHRVLGLARNETSEVRLRERGIEPMLGDLTDLNSLRNGALDSDATIHTAFGHDFANYDKMVQNDRDAIAMFVEALAETTNPLIATSAPAFLGDTGDAVADENYPIDENSIFVSRARAEADILAANEKLVRSVALRLPFYVYGRGGSSFVPFLIGQARANGAAYYVGDGAERTSAAHVEDVANGYLLALENHNAKGLYNIVAESPSNKEIAEAIGRLLDLPAQSISLEEAKEKFGAMIGFLTVNNQISADKAHRELGWLPSSSNRILDEIENGSYRNLMI